MDGIINVNKPKGITSFDVIRKLRKILSLRRIGHTGTLDPMAEGVLLVCVGKATKLASDIEASKKEYVAGFTLGYTTDTYDTEGKITDSVDNFSVSQKDIEDTLKKFVGQIKQVPPMYSAIKINGQKLYDMARKGETIERPERDIFIENIELINFDGKNGVIKCTVSKGTYIRSLIYDIGLSLKTFAVMTSLVRTKVGNETIEKSITLEEIENLKNNGNNNFITDVEEYFAYEKINIIGEKNNTLFLNGNTLVYEKEDGLYRVYYENKFLGFASIKSNRLKGYKYF